MKRIGWIVFAVALVLRLGLVLPVAKDAIRTPVSSDFTMDARAYVEVADSLVTHGVFGYGGRASAFRPPLYPWLLAGSFEVFGRDFRAVRVLQALLGALTCVGLAALGRTAFGPRAGLFAGLGLAAYPFVLYFTGELLTETLYAALVVAFAWLATRWLFEARADARGARVETAALRLALAAGAALGLAILCRPAALFYALAAGLFAAWAFVRGARGRAAELLALCAVAAVVVLPWCVRNTRMFGRPVFVTTYTGLNLYKGLPAKDDRTSAVDLGYHQHMLEDPALAALPDDEAALDARALDYWKRAVRAQPGAYLAEKLRDSARFWADVNLSGNVARLAGLVMLGALAVYFVALLLALLESVHAWRAGRLVAVVVPLTIVLATWGGYAPFFAGKRFRVASVDPFLVLLAAAWVDRVIARRRASTPVPADPRTRRPVETSTDPSPR